MLIADYIKFIPLILFVVLLALQTLFPRRAFKQGGLKRISHNLLLFVINTLLMRVAVPLSLIAVSIWASSNSLGLMNWLALPAWLSVLLCVMALDFFYLLAARCYSSMAVVMAYA